MEKKDVRDELNEVRLEKERLRLAQEKKEFENAGRLQYQSENKSELEFSRYKQDCRKRALEVAERCIAETKGRDSSDAIIKYADKYYNWLISIPE